MRHMTLVSRIVARSAIALCQVVLAGPGAAATPIDPSGTWLTEDGRARVRIERCGIRTIRMLRNDPGRFWVTN